MRQLFPNKKKKRVLITGGTGMVGKALMETCPESIEAFPISSQDYDLTDTYETRHTFSSIDPDAVIHLAAKVGGVQANKNYQADFCMYNLQINANVLETAADNDIGVNNLVSLLSTCIYPDEQYVQYPLTEDQLHNGPPHQSNYGYAHSKRMLEVLTRSINEQYGKNYKCLAPVNLYGPYDSFSLEDSHVVPATIRKIYEAKYYGKKPVFWGDGKPLRQFLYSYDLARMVWNAVISPEMIEDPITGKETYITNVGNPKEHSIKELIDTVIEVSGYDYRRNIVYDSTKPNGQYRKPAYIKTNLGILSTDLKEGIKQTYQWFEQNYPNVRGVEQ